MPVKPLSYSDLTGTKFYKSPKPGIRSSLSCIGRA